MRLGNGVNPDSLNGLLGIPDGQPADLEQAWQQRGEREHLRAPLGIAVDGTRLELDLKEPRLGGTGPHGLLAGAAGSGKSALLGDLLYTLALAHSPEDVNFLLADWSSPEALGLLPACPHQAGIATGLGSDPARVQHLAQAIAEELMRRQETLRGCNLTSISEYRQARQQGTNLPPLPSLVIAIDGADELLAAYPDFTETLTRICRIGLGTGVHLLLAGNRLDDSRPYLPFMSFAIALRTATAAGSRAAIGTPDAAELPPQPGSGYLRAAPGAPVQFRWARRMIPPPETFTALRDAGRGARPVLLPEAP